MKVKLALVAFVLLVAGISRAEAQHYRHQKKHYKHYKKSYYHHRPAAVVYYQPVVYRSRYHSRPYPMAYSYQNRYRHHRHLPPGHAKKYYKYKSGKYSYYRHHTNYRY